MFIEKTKLNIKFVDVRNFSFHVREVRHVNIENVEKSFNLSQNRHCDIHDSMRCV